MNLEELRGQPARKIINMLALLLNHFAEEADARALGKALVLLHREGLSWEQASDTFKRAVEEGLLEFNAIGGLVLTDAGRETLAEATSDIHQNA